MSLRKSPTRTPALLAANRRNAQKSTGPRTKRGKALSRMNALRTGHRSRLRMNLWLTVLCASPTDLEALARMVLTSEMALNPILRETAETFLEVEGLSAQNYSVAYFPGRGHSRGK